jgi:hypothetical protein
MKMPAFQFYPADWRKDPGVQALGYFERGVWFEMLCLMHESSERGVLLLNERPFPDEALANTLGLPLEQLRATLAKLLAYGVAKQRDDGAIYNKRMVEDEIECQKRREDGHSGGNPKLSDRYNAPGFLYAVRRESDGATKIGIAINPVNRLNKLRYACKPDVLEMIACLQVEDMGKAEAEAHESMASKQILGEWFALDDADLLSLGFTLKGKDKGKDKSEDKGNIPPSSSSSSSTIKTIYNGCADALPLPDEIPALPFPEDNSLPKDKPKKKPARRPPAPPLQFDFTQHCFVGLQSDQIGSWATAYPLVDVQSEILRAGAWVDAHDKVPRRDYKRFLQAWIARTQERLAEHQRQRPDAAVPVWER